MTTPGYPYMDGPQKMDWPDAPEASEGIPAGMGGMNWPTPGNATPSPDPQIEDTTATVNTLNTAQQNSRNSLRG